MSIQRKDDRPLNNRSRRQLLRASGLTISLPLFNSLGNFPFLQAAAPQQTGHSNSTTGNNSDLEAAKRFCCIFFPNGVSLPPEDHPAHSNWHWFPHATGNDFQFTETLRSLEPHRPDVSILSGLSHPTMRSSIAHITADSFLTGADSSRTYNNSISLDQLIAAHIGTQTRFSSLALSSDGGVGAPGRTKTLSFSASGRPIPSLSNPRAIFNRLFGVENQSLAEQRRKFGRDRSILDNVLAETETMRQQLSGSDRQRLEEYTTSVREIEHRLERADQWLDTQRPTVNANDFDLNVEASGDAAEYIRVIFDLMHVALLTDSTRAITYQITSEDAKGIGDNFPKSLGLKGHHALTHDIGNKDYFQNWARYDQFLAEQFAYFVQRLKTTPDPSQDGSLLDNTILLYGCSTSRTHQAVNYPLVLAGGRSLGFRHGHHHHFDESKFRLSDLFATVLQQLKLPLDHFADSTRTLSEFLS